MGEKSKIEWLNGGHTASPWHGCEHAKYFDSEGNEHAHEGCFHCYAEMQAKRNPGTLGVWGPEGTRVMSASFAKNCRVWNKDAARRGVIETVFPSICDPFEDWQGPILRSGYRVRVDPRGFLSNAGFRDATMDDLRHDLFTLIDECTSLRFLLLTKRPQNVLRMTPRYPCNPPSDTQFRANIWLLTSVSDQATADAMIPDLLKCRDLVPVLGLSAEPLLGPIEFSNVTKRSDALHQWGKKALSGIDWVIVGGESGTNSRACDIGWIRSIRDQCKNVNVACFIKQLGANVVWNGMQGGYMDGVPDVWPKGGSIDTGRGNWQKILMDKKGGDWEEWPMDLRVREYPISR